MVPLGSRRIVLIGAITLVLTTISLGVLLVDVVHNTLHANVLTNALFVATGVMALVLRDEIHRESIARDQHVTGRMSGLKSAPNREN